MNILNLDVELSFGRNSKGDFYLEIIDDASSLRIADLQISPDEFADMMSGIRTTATLKLWRSNRHGLDLEIEEVSLPLEDCNDMAMLKIIAKTWEDEHPGWRISSYDLKEWNELRYNDGQYKVTVERWI